MLLQPFLWSQGEGLFLFCTNTSGEVRPVAKFNKATKTAPAKPASVMAMTSPKSPIKTKTKVTGRTGEGAPGYEHGDKSALFLLAVTNMVAQNTFYESAGSRDARYEELVTKVALKDPAWIIGFFGWLRSEANMRSASVVGALVAAKAMVDAKVPGARQMVASVLQRADEPGEALAYWIQTYGRTIPKPVKRGVADAATRLYNEYTLLKYDTASHAFRFGDVLDLTHPSASADWQSELYRYALARRHGRDEEPGQLLGRIRGNIELREQLELDPQFRITPELLQNTAMTWEDILSLLGSKVDKRKLWEALIPSMGYMAAIRNLRNFDEAGVSDAVADRLAEWIADPAAVAKSRQFPFRFLSAYRATQGSSLRWGNVLEKALSASVSNIPELPGRTLVLVDRSGSMRDPLNPPRPGARRNPNAIELSRADAAAVFGGAIALRNPGRVTLVQFGTGSQEIAVPTGRGSLLKLVEKFTNMGGTNTGAATRQHFAGHDRVIIITDEQSHDGDPGTLIPKGVPLYTWNLAGYQFTGTAGGRNRHTFGGMVDASFKMIPLLEAGLDAGWPWETSPTA